MPADRPISSSPSAISNNLALYVPWVKDINYNKIVIIKDNTAVTIKTK